MTIKLVTACSLVYAFLLVSNAFLWEVDAAGECGKTPIRSAAASLSPCLSAAGNAQAQVPPACCTKVGALIRSAPRCLCAVLLSPLAKQAGIKPAIAITIPKRCNIKNRQAGKKCGSKFLSMSSPYYMLLLYYNFVLPLFFIPSNGRFVFNFTQDEKNINLYICSSSTIFPY